MKRIVIWAGLALVLGSAGWGVWSNERILANGRVVLLELAPVDPRSLMQGDYMALDYALSNELRRERQGADHEDEGSPRETSQRADGYAVVRLDERRLASLVRAQPDAAPLGADEIAIRYRVRDGRFRIATNAFFFQEGHGQEFSAARYGEFRISDTGEPRLTAMLDAGFKRLGQNRY
ncbi:MAG: GDYXXLXY domain-containing protein [Desulfovibrionaceae bacterium]|nr:GDYXXLXY domain-containing protein [Desulfovibrionaceae bacterium]